MVYGILSHSGVVTHVHEDGPGSMFSSIPLKKAKDASVTRRMIPNMDHIFSFSAWVCESVKPSSMWETPILKDILFFFTCSN